MCGIAGIIGIQPSGTNIRSMLQRMAHRGPNGLYYYESGQIALGHARLSIIDLSTSANQPMEDPATGNVIVFNGEIYNYIEIKKEIGNRYHFRTDSDTETILAAYAVYGNSFLSKLRGMFALALLNKKTGELLIARDRFGIKPLYYRSLPGTLLFASEIKSLVNIAGLPDAVSEQKAYEFVANMQMDTDASTLFKDIHQLPPACSCKIHADGRMGPIEAYWDFPQPGSKRFNQQAADELVHIFDDTIRVHLRSDVQVGSFLSGGIDSSSVTAFALRNLQQPVLHTFSAVLPYFHPENALIGDVTENQEAIREHKFMLSGERFFDDVPDLLYHHDEPTLDGSMYAHYKLCELAGASKVTVLLSGSGGDELFGGYASHIHAHHAKLLSAIKLSRYLNDVRQVKAATSMTYKSLLIKSIYDNVPVSIRRKIKNRQIRNKVSHLAVEPFFQHYYHAHKDPYFANLVNNYRSWTAPPFLHYEDRNSMAFGVETRVPFFDHLLIEHVLQYTSEDVIKGQSKSLLRKSFKGIVPDTILQQKGKYGFPSPIDHALKEDVTGRELFYDLYKNVPMLKQKETAQLADQFYQGKADVSLFWRTFSFILWYHIYFKNWKQYFHVA